MERIYVTVRARPLSSEDTKSSPWRISGNVIVCHNQYLKFEFDRIFGEECKTKEVYEARTQDIVAAAVQGFNGTGINNLFDRNGDEGSFNAANSTNSGKTHTMRGSLSEPGVIPLAVRDLFDTIKEVTDREFLLRISYMEIYNEEINDLLVPEHRRLQIHESLERGIYVAGLREEIVASPEQVLELMESGESNRHIGETNMNLYSSRSHTIFRMIIESRDKLEDAELGNTCDAVRVSVLNLVDLAGSERAAKTGAEGVRLKEGSHINKSLMTLGTVIKKLSEGAESQGGHVPYRDSKLTRILQPALGGNSNTAIICNITLAQIHADETKSSLQFASRALRVTNCAHVNEILTDAALLKRQKKEIEELRAKLKASHSEHLEEEILNLRNMLLQTESERERMALELEEEKRSKVERDKRLEAQEKKIKNLSSMVLLSNRDEVRDHHKRDKRRDTWCPGKLLRESLTKVSSNVKQKASTVENVRPVHKVGPLLSFEELLKKTEGAEACNFKENFDDTLENLLPDPGALLNVTNRRKGPAKKKHTPMSNELSDLQEEYENLLLEFETQRTFYEVQADCLKRKLVEVTNNSTPSENTLSEGKIISLRESEAIHVIKQLQEQIKGLEFEKSLSQQNLDNVVELATEQSTFVRQKCEELYKEAEDAKHEARMAHNQLAFKELAGKSLDGDSDCSLEVQGLFAEVQHIKAMVDSILSDAGEFFDTYNPTLHFSNLKSSMCQSTMQLNSIITDYGKLKILLEKRVMEVENEKLVLQNKSADLHEKIEGLILNIQNSEKAFQSLSEQHELEKAELFSQIDVLERKVFSLSSSSLSKEKESLRKDLDKTRTRLKDTEFKLKNAIQDKTRLEGEKANVEREVKKLHNQKALLERDISRRESLAGRRRESAVDFKRNNNLQQALQDDYRRLEVLAFEMETTIASLEGELASVNQQKQEISAKNECLSTELEALSEKYDMSTSELSILQEEILGIRVELDESQSLHNKSETQVNLLLEEKEELATQLTNALLEMEEERAIWFAKEKASVEAIKDKTNAYNADIMSLSREISNVRNAMSSLSEECNSLQEKLKCAEEKAEADEKISMEKSLEIELLKHELDASHSEKMKNEAKLKMLSMECNRCCDEVTKLQTELGTQRKEKEHLVLLLKEREMRSDLSNDTQVAAGEGDSLMTQTNVTDGDFVDSEVKRESCDDELLKANAETEELAERITALELKMHNDHVQSNKEKTKLTMRLKSTQSKLDAFRDRYKESVDEREFMNSKYEEASSKLKEKLAGYAMDVLNLKKQLAASKLTDQRR